ncbi:MAG: hypothetical protein NHB32_31810 [Fischerella sp. CENA71]|nr:hypothetical protein [Fischerella sp. CENA71]
MSTFMRQNDYKAILNEMTIWVSYAFENLQKGRVDDAKQSLHMLLAIAEANMLQQDEPEENTKKLINQALNYLQTHKSIDIYFSDIQYVAFKCGYRLYRTRDRANREVYVISELDNHYIRYICTQLIDEIVDWLKVQVVVHSNNKIR